MRADGIEQGITPQKTNVSRSASMEPSFHEADVVDERERETRPSSVCFGQENFFSQVPRATSQEDGENIDTISAISEEDMAPIAGDTLITRYPRSQNILRQISSLAQVKELWIWIKTWSEIIQKLAKKEKKKLLEVNQNLLENKRLLLAELDKKDKMISDLEAQHQEDQANIQNLKNKDKENKLHIQDLDAQHQEARAHIQGLEAQHQEYQSHIQSLEAQHQQDEAQYQAHIQGLEEKVPEPEPTNISRFIDTVPSNALALILLSDTTSKYKLSFSERVATPKIKEIYLSSGFNLFFI